MSSSHNMQLMANPPMTSTPRRIPTASQISWPSTLPQFAALASAVGIGWFAVRSGLGVMLGAVAYLIYSFVARTFIPRAHRRGIELSRNQEYEEAIACHEQSYDFFTRNSWLDRYRAITMMSPSAMSFREMSLVNIAFAYGQIGNGDKAKDYYQRALNEYPNSGMASVALKLIESIERSRINSEGTK